MSKQHFLFPGPLIHLPDHPPRVTISRGWWSASVSWEPGGLHSNRPALKVLRRRLEDAGMTRAVDAWIEENFGSAVFVNLRQGSVLWGGVHGVDKAAAAQLAELVGGFFARAVEHPLRLDEVERTQNCEAPSPVFFAAETALPPLPENLADTPGFIIPWVYFGTSHEPFTVIPWTGNTRERASESLDSPEWEGIAPDGERLWFSASDSVLLKPESRTGQDLRRWLVEQRDETIATLTAAEAADGGKSAEAAAMKRVIEAAERWQTALSVSIEVTYAKGGDRNERGTLCYNLAECDLRDAVEALWLARGEPVGSDRVLPSYGDLEREAQQHLDPPKGSLF